MAYHKAVQHGVKPKVLLNVLNEFGDRSRSHGIPKEILLAQAQCINTPIEFIASSWTDYEKNYIARLEELKPNYQFNSAVFGDIDIQSHRDWEEKVSHAAGLIPMLPLWQQDRTELEA